MRQDSGMMKHWKGEKQLESYSLIMVGACYGDEGGGYIDKHSVKGVINEPCTVQLYLCLRHFQF